jgi:hypothetical protein
MSSSSLLRGARRRSTIRAAKFGGLRTRVRPTTMDLLGGGLPLKGDFGARIHVHRKIDIEQSTRVIGFKPRHI